MKRRRRQRQRMLVLLGAVVLLAVVLIVIISSCSKKNQGAGITAQAFSTIALLMSVCIMWGMVLSVFFNKRYLGRLGSGKKSSGGAGFGDIAMTAMFIGLVSAYIGSYIGTIVSGNGLFTFTGNVMPLIVAVVSGAVMALFVYLAEKKKQGWVDSFSVAGSMLIGMAAAVLIKL